MEGQDEKRKVPGSESVERPWASNDKVQFDNVITHEKIAMGLSEQTLAESVALQKKVNDMYIAREQQRLEHSNELETQRQENNRYTLNYLYGVYPEEAVGIVAIGKILVDLLKKEGLVAKKE